MDEFTPRYNGGDDNTNPPAYRTRNPTRARSTTTTSSSSSGSSSTAGTSPYVNTYQLPKVDPSSSRMQTNQNPNAFASTSAQPAYYPMPSTNYMSFQSPFSGPGTSSPPPVMSESPPPILIPNPSNSLPVPMARPLQETIGVPVEDLHDSGVDFGPGVPSRASSTTPPPVEAPLFRSRSLMGFAKSQSRLGFFKPRLPSVTSEPDSDSELDPDLELVAPHYHTYDESARALIEELRPIMESCIEIVVRLIPTPQVSSSGRLARLRLGREEEASASMETTLRHLWSCITLRPGCACPDEEEQQELPEGERGSDICREFHEAFERKLRRFTTRMRTFFDHINRPRKIHKATFTERLLGWQDAFDQWINRFERLNAYLRLRLAHAHAKQLQIQLQSEREAMAQIQSAEHSVEDGRHSRRSTSSRHRDHTMLIEQLKADYDLAKGALLEAHKRAAGLAWRRDTMGLLVRDFGTWAIRDAV